MTNKIFVKSRVSRQHGGPPAKVDTIAVGREILASVIDFEGADFHAIGFESDAFLDLARIQFDASRGIVLSPHTNIDKESLRQVLHHLLRTFRSENRQRRTSFSPRPSNPTGQPQIGKSDDVIRMMMSQKNAGDIREGDAKLVQALHGATAGIENKLLPAGFYQRARTEPFHARRRRAAAQKRDAKNILRRVSHFLTARYL